MSQEKNNKPQAPWRTRILAKPLIQSSIDAEKERITAEQLRARQIRRSVEDHFFNIANRDPLFN